MSLVYRRCTSSLTSYRSVSTCTSYSGILSGTVDGVVTLKNASGASSLIITGGTEVGHASGTYSHANGYKVDVRHSTTLDNYITSAFTKIGNRGDGFPQWQAASGNIYCVSDAFVCTCANLIWTSGRGVALGYHLFLSIVSLSPVS